MDRVKHFITKEQALCGAYYEDDGTLTVTWSKNHVSCLVCLELLGLRRHRTRSKKEEE